MFNKYQRKQYLATCCVNIIAIGYGATIAWPSPSIPILESSDNPIKTGPLTLEQLSWVGSIMCIGGFIGTFLFGFLSNWLGRKTSLCILAFPQFISCLLLFCTQNIYYLLASRFLAGMTGGGVFVVIPLYVAEISDDKIRGTLSAMFVLCINVGILFMYVLGDCLSYSMVPMVLTILPILFFIGVLFLPETPFFLMKSNKEKKAESSWRFFHDVKRRPNQSDLEPQIHLEKLTHFSNEVQEVQVQVVWRDFITPVARRAFLISIVLIGLSELSGCLPMLTYTASIFKEAGSDLTPNLATVIVGIIQLIGSYLSTILVDKAGRKILLLISYFGTALGFLVMGIHSYFKLNNYDVSSFGWVPIASFSFMIFVANFGVLTLPFVVMSEVLPEKIRDTASTISMLVLWIIAFLTLKFFPIMTEVIGMHGSMFLFSGFCFLGAVFVAFFVPETKGKSFDEIMLILQKQ